jgi:tetratricopeptide (TPR) repeat protein
MIKKKQATLLKTQKSDTAEYMSLYDDIAELTISKNALLYKMDRANDIDADKTCDLALDYAEVEFIKTQYYKTPFHDEVAKTLENIASLYERCHPPMAERYLKPIIKIKEHIYTKESVEVAKAHDALGDYYYSFMSNFKKAIKEYEEAKRIREKLYGTNDPRTAENYELLALSLYYHGGNDNVSKHDFIKITQKMIEGKIFYSQYEDNSFYIQTQFKNINPSDSFGEVVYTMMNSPESKSGSVEPLPYKLENGKVIINGNDGSSSRLTLVFANDSHWILFQENDIDGEDKQFGFEKWEREVFYLKKPKGYPALEKCKPFEGECFIKAR